MNIFKELLKYKIGQGGKLSPSLGMAGGAMQPGLLPALMGGAMGKENGMQGLANMPPEEMMQMMQMMRMMGGGMR